MTTQRTSPLLAGTQTEAFSWLFTSSSTGAAVGAAVGGVLVASAGPGLAFACAGIAGGLATLVAILGSLHLGPRHPNAATCIVHRCG